MNNIGIKRMTFIIFVASLILTACGKKQVDYQVDTLDPVHTETDAVSEAGGDVSTQLGMGEERSWHENIHYVYGSPGGLDYEEYDIKMNAHIYIPDTDKMYTMTGSEWYLSPEEKKHIMTYFVDESSIEKDMERTYTKEYYQNEVEHIKNDFLPYVEPVSENEEDQAVYEQSLNDCIAYFETKASETPTAEEIAAMAEDYDGNAYMGSRDGVEYGFSFYRDEERNRSGFSIARIYDYDENMNPIPFDTDFELTEENAKLEAEKICQGVGLDDLKVIGIRKETLYMTEDEGKDIYRVNMGRNIEGIPVDMVQYWYESNEIGGDSDDYRIRIYDLGYSLEKVTLLIDEGGFCSMNAYGLIRDCCVEKPVKLLGFEQIKEVVKNELSTRRVKSEIQEWQQMDLIYLRIADQDAEDKVRYIPVWRICATSFYMLSGSNSDEADTSVMCDSMIPSYMLLFVNAMDGSIIDLRDVGAGLVYMYSGGFGDYE